MIIGALRFCVFMHIVGEIARSCLLVLQIAIILQLCFCLKLRYFQRAPALEKSICMIH